VNPMELMNHFPVWQTFNNMVTLASEMFGLEFEVSGQLVSFRRSNKFDLAGCHGDFLLGTWPSVGPRFQGHR
jgi:hypothetical protein